MGVGIVEETMFTIDTVGGKDIHLKTLSVDDTRVSQSGCC